MALGDLRKADRSSHGRRVDVIGLVLLALDLFSGAFARIEAITVP